MKMRIGHGFDVHKFGGELPLLLCGVDVAYDSGLIAHSDGDVVLHAIADAILGALALGDIGKHFPDTDPDFKNADSRVLLRHCYQLVLDKGFEIGNLDVTIIAQAPKISPYIAQMRSVLVTDLNTDVDNISIKATTTERLGFTGRKEGIAVEAVVLMIATSN